MSEQMTLDQFRRLLEDLSEIAERETPEGSVSRRMIADAQRVFSVDPTEAEFEAFRDRMDVASREIA